ncbi:MAG: hypothetical protein IKB27_04360 [Clostridia bacterium]|nr:hypothetical protein [Clostridia bacterium]
MKKVLLIIAIVLCSLCLFACNNEETDNSNNSTNSDIPSFEMQNVSNLQCEIVFGQTNEEIVFEKEKALELYNIIANFDYTELDGMPSKSSVDPSSDYINVNFTGDKYSEEFPTELYGCYRIYTDDLVSWNLSKYMSYISYYQYEEGLYNAVSQYIEGNR